MNDRGGCFWFSHFGHLVFHFCFCSFDFPLISLALLSNSIHPVVYLELWHRNRHHRNGVCIHKIMILADERHKRYLFLRCIIPSSCPEVFPSSMHAVINIHESQGLRTRKGTIHKRATAYKYCELGGGMEQIGDSKK